MSHKRKKKQTEGMKARPASFGLLVHDRHVVRHADVRVLVVNVALKCVLARELLAAATRVRSVEFCNAHERFPLN